MAGSRDLLEIAAEYVSYKQAAQENAELIAESEAEAHLSAIAERFDSALEALTRS